VNLTSEYKWSIGKDEMINAVEKLSWKTSTGVDDMPDTFFHGILDDDRKAGNDINIRWLSEKV
jgi:hypothetical protein